MAPMLTLNVSYYVVMSFVATLTSDGTRVRFLPGESVYLKTDHAGDVSFESGRGTCECSRETFRFATMRALQGLMPKKGST